MFNTLHRKYFLLFNEKHNHSLDEKPWKVQLDLFPLWLYVSMVTV